MKSMIIMIFFLICFSLIQGFIFEQISEFNKTESYITYNDTYDVKDDYLFSTTIRGFQIFHLNSDSLELVNDFNLEKFTYLLKIKDDFMFVSCGIDRLYKFDITNITEPVLLDSITMPGCYSFFFNNDYLYINELLPTLTWKIHIYDYNTMEELFCYDVPQEYSSLKKIGENIARVKIYEHVFLYDMSAPDTLVWIADDEISEHSCPDKIEMFSNSLLVIGSGLGRFEIYDISQPTDWQLITFIDYDGMCFNIIDDRLIIKEYRTLFLFDISDLSEPVLLDSTSIASYDRFDNLKAFGNNIFAGTYAGKLIYYKLSDDHFQVNQTISNGGKLRTSYQIDDNLYIFSYCQGIKHWNVSVPANPELIASYWFDLTSRKIDGAEDILIAYGSDILLEKWSNVVFRIMPDGSLEELDRLYSQDTWVDGLHYHPDYGFFLTENDTLHLYTLDDEDKLEEIFNLEIPEIILAEFIFVDNVAYIVGLGKMLVIANIDDISQMSVVNEIEIEDYSWFLSYGIYENLLFLGSNDYIFQNKVYDISQPENPLLFAELDNFGVVSIDADNDILFAGFTDTYAFDISNIATTGTALEIQEFPVWHRTEDLYSFEQNGEYYFYILDQNSCRIFHYDNTATEDYIEDINPFLKNFPNPFNPSTTIQFTAEHTENTENTELSIYNIKGQKVKTFLINSYTHTPINSIIWDGTDDNNKPVSSGIYLYKLKVNDKTMSARKCILLK